MTYQKIARNGIHQHDDWDEVHQNMIEVQEKQRVQKKSLPISDPGDSDEVEADTFARKVMSGDGAKISGSALVIQRKEDKGGVNLAPPPNDGPDKATLEANFQAFKEWKLNDIRAKHKRQTAKNKKSHEEKKFIEDAAEFEQDMKPNNTDNFWGEAQYNEALKKRRFLRGYEDYLNTKITETQGLATTQVNNALNELNNFEPTLQELINTTSADLNKRQGKIGQLSDAMADLVREKETMVQDIRELEQEEGQADTSVGFDGQYMSAVSAYGDLIAFLRQNADAVTERKDEFQRYLDDIHARQQAINDVNVQLQSATDASVVKNLYENVLPEKLKALSDAIAGAEIAMQKKIVVPNSDETLTGMENTAISAETVVKENAKAERETLLMNADQQMKIIAAITMEEGAMREEATKDGLRDIAWVYKNRIKSYGFAGAVGGSSAYNNRFAAWGYDDTKPDGYVAPAKYKKEGKNYVARASAYKSFESYLFGVTDPQPITYTLSEDHKRRALDVLDFVVRDVMGSKSDQKNPFSTFKNQGYYNDLRNSDKWWYLGRQFVFLWLKGEIPWEEFNSRMVIVGEIVGMRTFLYDADAIESYLKRIGKLPQSSEDVPDIDVELKNPREGAYWQDVTSVKIQGMDIPVTRY